MNDLSPREDIAYTVFRLIDETFGYRGGYPGDLDYRIADAILAAGYTKPTLTAPTAEEIDAEALRIANINRHPSAHLRFLSTLAPHALGRYRELARKSLESQ